MEGFDKKKCPVLTDPVLKTSSFEHRVFYNFAFTELFAAMKAYVNFGQSTSHGVINRLSSVC